MQARTVIIATGARYRRLDDVDNLDRFESSGVHYAATAIEAGLCEGEEVSVVGGGNSPGQAAVFLSRYASHVHVLVRGDGLASSMSDYLVSRIEAAPDRITLHPHTEITALNGERHLESVTWCDRDSGEADTQPIANVFLMLGAVPNTEWLHDAVMLEGQGFVCTGAAAGTTSRGAPRLLETSLPGLFAIGDVRADSIKRVASGVGEGSVVVSSVHQFLADGD